MACWSRKMFLLFVFLTCVIQFSGSSCTDNNVCLNGGKCSSNLEACECNENFFGVVCEEHAASYKIWLTDAKVTEANLLVSLESIRAVKVEIDEQTRQAIVIFHMKSLHKDTIIQILTTQQLSAGTHSVGDLNECVEKKVICPTNKVCENTDGSFMCACASGYQAEGSTCVSTSIWKDKNLSVWVGIIGGILLLLIFTTIVVYYRRRLRRKNMRKKISEQKEKQEEDRIVRSSVTSSSNSNYVDDGRKTSKSSSYAGMYGNRNAAMLGIRAPRNDVPGYNQNKNYYHNQIYSNNRGRKAPLRHFGRRANSKYNSVYQRNNYNTTFHDLPSTKSFDSPMNDDYDYLQQYGRAFDSSYVNFYNEQYIGPYEDEYMDQYIRPHEVQYDTNVLDDQMVAEYADFNYSLNESPNEIQAEKVFTIDV